MTPQQPIIAPPQPSPTATPPAAVPPHTLAELIKAKYPGAYDAMDDMELEKAVRSKYPGVYDQIPSSQPKQVEQPGIVSQLAGTLGRTALATSDALSYPLRDPEGFIKSVLAMPAQLFQAQGVQAQKAYEAVKAGRPTEAGLRVLASIVPVAGPITADYVDADQSGKEQIAGNAIGGMLMGKIPVPTSMGLPSMRVNMNPRIAGAIDTARAEGVPVNVGVASGNRALTSLTQLAEKTTATGAGAVNAAAQATERGLMDWADRVAAEANPGKGAVSGAQAGEGVFDALKKTIQTEGQTAERGYSTVEQAFQAGKLNGVPLASIRGILKPIYDHLDALNKSTGGLDAATAVGQTKAYLDMFMKADVPGGEMPVIAAERVLGNLKEALRGQSNQMGATAGQLKTIIKSLQGQIDAAVKVDPIAFDALQEGRLATAKKYQAASTLDKLAGRDQMRSPITATNELLADSGLTKLRRLAVQSPDAVSNLGRSFFQDAFKDARLKENGFKLDNASRDWRAMSDDTKRIVYKDAIAKDPQYLNRVDEFFTAASKIQENMNPSGSAAAGANYLKLLLAPMEAVIGAASGHPVMGAAAAGATVAQDVLAGQFAKAMNNPRVVQLMVDGAKLYQMSPSAARTARLHANLASIATIMKSANTPQPTPGVGAKQDEALNMTGRATGAGAYRGGIR